MLSFRNSEFSWRITQQSRVCDVAGEVLEVHLCLADVYSTGDRVIRAAGCLDRKDGAYCYSGFQECGVLKSPSIAKVSKDVVYEDVVALPPGINTAASSLFADETLGLKLPAMDGTKVSPGKTLLTWGASSSVGSCGVQLTIQAGYEVVGVVSERNHEMVKGLGAKICFDQSDPNIVDDITAHLSVKEVVGAYDAVSHDSTLNALCEILDRCSGRKFIASVMPGAEHKVTKGVEIHTNFVANMASSGKSEVLWQWLSKAMEENKIMYMPQSEVVGKGLDHVQHAVDLLRVELIYSHSLSIAELTWFKEYSTQ